MPYQEIQALGFSNSPRKLGLYEKPWVCISWYGPCTQLVNSKNRIPWGKSVNLSCPGFLMILSDIRVATNLENMENLKKLREFEKLSESQGKLQEI